MKNVLRTYNKIQKIATGQRDYYTTGCLLDHLYFKNYYKMIALDLSKQQAPAIDPKAINKLALRPQKTCIYFVPALFGFCNSLTSFCLI